jgi:hypothetical protein
MASQFAVSVAPVSRFWMPPPLQRAIDLADAARSEPSPSKLTIRPYLPAGIDPIWGCSTPAVMCHACSEIRMDLTSRAISSQSSDLPYRAAERRGISPTRPDPPSSTWVSRPMGLHHRPLAEPSVRLSPHSAPIRQTCRSYRCSSARKEPLAPLQALEERCSHGPCGL